VHPILPAPPPLPYDNPCEGRQRGRCAKVYNKSDAAEAFAFGCTGTYIRSSPLAVCVSARVHQCASLVGLGQKKNAVRWREEITAAAAQLLVMALPPGSNECAPF